MPDKALRVRMLGDFSISSGTATVSSGSGRSKKLWLLIACLLCRRGECVPPEELIGLFWGDDAKGSNPSNALKTLFHRARAQLDGLWEGAGHDLLLRQEGGYTWAPDVPIEVDADRFLASCQSASEAADEETRLTCLLEAAALYRGDFLEKLSTDPWAQPIAARYRRMYMDCAQEAQRLLEARARWPEAAALCRAAWKQDPCNELFCQGLMNALLQTGDRQGAAEAYTEMRERLMSEQGVLPSVELRELYESAQRATSPNTLSAGQLLARLQEAPASGAMICGFDFFQSVCQAYVRASERSGDALQLALLSVTGESGALPSHSLERVMDHLQEVLRRTLRRGDAAARCSASQFAVLLPQASYANGGMVCQRIVKAFIRQYPHSPARLQTEVQPLAPSQQP